MATNAGKFIAIDQYNEQLIDFKAKFKVHIRIKKMAN